MHSTYQVTRDTFWVGASDRRLECFENLFVLPNGISYNSYLIFDEKIALLDTVDLSVQSQFLANVNHLLESRSIDYLVLTHLEPDHGGAISEIIERHPAIQLVGSKKAHQLFEQFFPLIAQHPFIEIGEGDTLSLGSHTLRFSLAPMVHWPEVVFALDELTGALFTADAFGTFGALSGNIFADEVDFEHNFLDEARRYYANIVGKYGQPVQSALKKLPLEKINYLCPLHGPIWRKDLSYFFDKYDLWSKYLPEKSGVVMVYTSMYGHTASLVQGLAQRLADRGVTDIHIYDVAKTNASYCVSEVWKYSHLVLASPTYNLGIHYAMDAFLHEISSLNIQNRKVSLLANHSWASAAMRLMTEKVSAMKDMEIIGESIDVKSNTVSSYTEHFDALADAIVASMK
ncbi:MAG: FprA family A-type flavoprotein [Clostridiales bacterium]|nr:FprA family A-type flavoprotein [Clostridiales bacterium]